MIMFNIFLAYQYIFVHLRQLAYKEILNIQEHFIALKPGQWKTQMYEPHTFKQVTGILLGSDPFSGHVAEVLNLTARIEGIRVGGGHTGL